MIQKIVRSLTPVSAEDLRTLRESLEDIRSLRTSLEDLRLLRASPEDLRALLRATPLDQSVTVGTLPAVQCTVPLNVLVFDYSYLVVNIGASPALATLQASPDGATWEIQSDTKTINPGTVVSFVPDVIAKFARLCYQSQPASPNTTLQIYIQGRTYN